ncbi:MAG: hypothetical protein KC652_18260 [Cyanobacteria bacterium HKST-UBA01]|nr:hypothetical protein [Cyanobacteria bacterium HKST-UBA01]
MEKFVDGMVLRGESILAFQHAYPVLNLVLIVGSGAIVLGLIVWALFCCSKKSEPGGK